MEAVGVKKKVQTYYQDEKSLDRIWGQSSDFFSEVEKNLASWFVTSEVEYLSKISKSKDFQSLQLNLKDLEEFLSIVPEMENYLDSSKIVSNFFQARSHNKIMNVFLWDDYEFLFLQVSKDEVVSLSDELTKICLDYVSGSKNLYKEELLTHPEPETFKSQINLALKRMQAPVIQENSLSEELLAGQKASFAPESFLGEHYNSLIRSFLLFPELAEPNLSFFKKHKADLKELETLWTPVSIRILSSNLQDHFSLVEKNKSITLFDGAYLEEIIYKNPLALDFLLTEGFFSQKQILEKTLKLSERTQQVIIFKEVWEALKHKIVFNEVSFNQMSLSLNNKKDSFSQQVWDLICQSYVIDHMPRGNKSFSYHYPMFYEDVVELDNEKLFYTEQEFAKYIQERKKTGQEREFIRDLAESMLHKIRVVNNVLKEDLNEGTNKFTQHRYSDQELTVLGAFQEKLNSAQMVVAKIMEKTQNPTFSIASLFYAQENTPSFPNLKGFYLGELKIGGLENYEGHGVQLRAILEPLGFVLSAEIRKEIDHFIKVGDNKRISLTLVESKNFKKALTRRSPRLFEVMNQKRRLNESIHKAQGEILAQDDDMRLQVASSLCLSRGLSKNTKKLLLTEEMYDQVQGLELDFSKGESVIDDTFKLLVEKIKKRLTMNKSIDPDLFEEDLHELSNMILMVEEDSEDNISGNKKYSDSIQNRVLVIMKKYSSEFKEKRSLVTHVFNEFVLMLDRKIQKFEQEEMV